MMNKIVQIAVDSAPEGFLYALDEKGLVWRYVNAERVLNEVEKELEIIPAHWEQILP